VTGVQTCALPIYARDRRDGRAPGRRELDDEVLDPQQHVVAVAQVRRAGARHQLASTDRSPVTAAAAWGTLAARLRSSASRPSSVPTGYQQRYQWPGVSASTSGGASTRQRSCA